jgi:hypothetical protein
VGCHSGSLLSAGLDLSNASLTTNAKSLKDKMNVGTMGVTMLGDPNGCPPGTFKLVDSANPTNSLLYMKLRPFGDVDTHPCGNPMPVIGSFSSDDKTCVLRWIESVAALP